MDTEINLTDKNPCMTRKDTIKELAELINNNKKKLSIYEICLLSSIMNTLEKELKNNK